MHRDDAETPMEEIVGTLGDLIRAGKIRYIGLSNFRAWRVAAFVATCRAMGVPLPIVCQPCYNAMDRTPELELIPACVHHGLAVVPYSPLARGVLSAKYKPGATPPADSRAGRKDKRMLQTEFRDDSLNLAQTIAAHAAKRGMTAGEFAFNWVLNNRYVTSVVAGPRTFEQWAGYMNSFDHPFSAEDEALVDRLVAPGHPSTKGYTDPIYPATGRAAPHHCLTPRLPGAGVAPRRAQYWLAITASSPCPQAVRRQRPRQFEQALTLHQQGQLPAAAELYQAIIERDPTHFDALHLLGVIAAQSGDPARAADLIGRALLVDGTQAAAHYHRALALRDLGRHAGALEDLAAALALDPSHVDAWIAHAETLQDLRRPDEAVQSYGRAIVLAPGQVPAVRAQRPAAAIAAPCRGACRLRPGAGPGPRFRRRHP